MFKIFTALLLILAFFIIVKKKLDIRLTFLLFGIIFFLISNHTGELFLTFFNVQFLLLSVLAIMTSFGFAEILKLEKYSVETVKLFANSIERVKSNWFMIFFVSVLATWIASLSLLSANAACIIVVPIFLPTLIRFGISPGNAAIPLISGAWGSILNPGDVNANMIRNTIKNTYNLKKFDIIEYNLFPAIAALICITALFYIIFRGSSSKSKEPESGIKQFRKLNTRSLVSFFPFLLLAIWAVLPDNIHDLVRVNYVIIASLMIGSVIAILFARYISRENLVSHFFNGAWKGFKEVALLIITSKIFIEGFKASFGKDSISHWIISLENYQVLVAVIITFVFTILTGSGDAIVTSVIQVFIPLIGRTLAPMAASMVWFAGEIGRCASPVSAATVTVARLAGEHPNTIAKKAIIPVTIGLTGALIALAFFN